MRKVLIAVALIFVSGPSMAQNENEQELSYCIKGLAQRDAAFIQLRDTDQKLTALQKQFDEYKAAHQTIPEKR